MVATNGVALVKPVIGHPSFDEWHINCAIRYIWHSDQERCLEIIFVVSILSHE
jgi:hypothetical protein